MKQQINEKIEAIIADVKPSLGGADVQLKDINQGVVTLEYHKALSNPSACHVDRTKITKEIIIEILQDEFKRVLPDLKRIVVLGEE